jgi:ribosomal protein S18 acetylase RimI-like enzyme
MSADDPRQVAICRWADVRGKSRLIPQIDAIFFESSNTKTFADDAERADFRERWLGRYLAQEPEWAYLAIAGDGGVAGYLVGSIADPKRTKDAGSFQDFAPFMADYPAHLHVNLAPGFRNRGIGRDLIAAFAADAAHAGAKGMHVVTGAGARNVGFYERAGFRIVARTLVGARELVLLGRALAAPETS